MYRFLLRPKWIAFHLLVVVAIIAMLAAASWQWTRYGQRNDFVDSVHARQDAPPEQLTTLLANGTPADIQYHVVTALGSYAGTDLVQINQTVDGTNGVDVLTPFQIDDGPLIIVNRGFVADGATVPDAPAGTLRIGGTAQLSQQRQTGQLTDDASGDSNEVRRVDLALIGQRLGIDVAPVYIDFRGSDPASPTPPFPVPAPDLSGGPPHLSYTIQWLIFSVAVAVGWVLAVRRSIGTNRRRLAAGDGVGLDGVSAPDGLPVPPSA